MDEPAQPTTSDGFSAAGPDVIAPGEGELIVNLEGFEGPLDLLLYLIRKQNINVLDIPMAELTRQYLGYVEMMRRTQLELAAEYLLMAVLGGAGRVYGAILGAAGITFLRDQLQNFLPWLIGNTGNYETIAFGAVLVLILQTASNGLWPILFGPPPPPSPPSAPTPSPPVAPTRAPAPPAPPAIFPRSFSPAGQRYPKSGRYDPILDDP